MSQLEHVAILNDGAQIESLPSANDSITILVVDDNATNRQFLQLILEGYGINVIAAENGEQGVSMFRDNMPDMVLMDVMMPVMDGYEAAIKIKEMSTDQFVPITFLTAITDNNALAKCIDSGGDDFLSKPFNGVILKAKIDALMRMREMYNSLKKQKDEIHYYHQRLLQEHIVAEKVFENIAKRGKLSLPNVKYLLTPESITSGDVILCAVMPSGGLRIMLGDFTGHGLSAAIGAMPISDIFYTMTSKGYSLEDVIPEMNNKLKEILPAGFFCATGIVEISPINNTLAVWNGGIPDIIVANSGKIKRKFVSSHLALGVLDNCKLENHIEFVQWDEGDYIYLFSDGLTESRDIDGHQYGQQEIEDIITDATNTDSIFDVIKEKYSAYCGEVKQEDDVTLIEVGCNLDAIKSYKSNKNHTVTHFPGKWNVIFDFDANILKGIDPLPIIIQSLMEIQGLIVHREKLYTLLAELYSNALEHGILKLDSVIKNSPLGFVEYYEKREKALAELDDASIKIDISHEPLPNGGIVIINVYDSGDGFDTEKIIKNIETNSDLHGRGIPMIHSISQAITYHGIGNHAEVHYQWTIDE